jgi:hypothetical protein
MNVILTFYRNFIWPVTCITLISCYGVLTGSPKDLVYMFWMKVISNVGIGFYFEFFEGDQFYFFNNLGYSKSGLYISVAVLDFAIWLFASFCMLLI